MNAAAIQDFFQAIRSGDRGKVCSMLASDPALIDAKSETGTDSYTAAKYSRQEEIAALLLDELLRRGVALDIFAASIAGIGERVDELLSADRTLVNSYSPDGWTPLHLAAFFGQPRIARVLVESGADVHARSRNTMENHPIHAAAATRNADVIALLLERGADSNARQHGGWTALHAASQNGDEHLVRLLVAHGADITVRANNNQSAMDLALTGGHQAVVDILDEYETSQHGVS